MDGSCEIFCNGKRRAESEMRLQERVGHVDLRHCGLWLFDGETLAEKQKSEFSSCWRKQLSTP